MRKNRVESERKRRVLRNKTVDRREKSTHTHTLTWSGIMPSPARTHCCECGESLICNSCGQFMWNKIYIIDNAVLPWYFCRKECQDKFLQRLKEEKKEVVKK